MYINHTHLKAREFQIGDLILKHMIQYTKGKTRRKLKANWEGPYTVIAKGGKGSYTLIDQDRETLGRQ